MWARISREKGRKEAVKGTKTLSLGFSMSSRPYTTLTLLIRFLSMFVLFRIVAAITEGFIRGLATTAEGNTVANLVGPTVSRFNWDTSAYPNRPAHVHLRVFNQPDGLFKTRFNHLLCFFIKNFQTARWQSQASSIAVRFSFGSPDFGTRFQIPPARWQKRADAHSS